MTKGDPLDQVGAPLAWSKYSTLGRYANEEKDKKRPFLYIVQLIMSRRTSLRSSRRGRAPGPWSAPLRAGRPVIRPRWGVEKILNAKMVLYYTC